MDNLNFNRLLSSDSQSSWSIRLVTLKVWSRVYVLVTNRAALRCICSNRDIKVDCQGAHTVAAYSSWERINTVYANFLAWIEAHEILRQLVIRHTSQVLQRLFKQSGLRS